MGFSRYGAAVTIYLDHNSTTPPAPEVVDSMVEAMTNGYGNPSSSHVVGRAAAARIDDARDQVADLLKVDAGRLIWTSGATEALNTAIAAAAATHPYILTTRAEHKAVLDAVNNLKAVRGLPVCWVDVDAVGRPTAEAMAEAGLPTFPFTVIAMAANNETGVLTDIARLADLVHSRGGLLVCDATQQVGKLPVDLTGWGVDYAAMSAHKIYGPQGVGAMVVPRSVPAIPLIHGGSHQRGWRSGTLNVAGIVGFGVAAALAAGEIREGEPDRLAKLRDELLRLLMERLGWLHVNGGEGSRLPNTLNVRVEGVQADALIANCPGVAFSSGSACTSAVPTPSHVLTTMGLGDDHADESVRLSLGRGNDLEDVRQAAKSLGDAAERIRGLGT